MFLSQRTGKRRKRKKALSFEDINKKLRDFLRI
jgi:hypothetical protein